jgi:serine/threonine-protein kinase HipA
MSATSVRDAGPIWSKAVAHQLEVKLGGLPAGYLVETSHGRWSFVYPESERGIGAELPHPVSLVLPRSQVTHHGDTVRAVFSNLLPEGELRRRLGQSLGLSEGNEFALLARLAGDCHGALTLRTPGTPAQEPGLRQLTDEDLRNAMAVLPAHPLLAEASDLRLSLPGEFDKLPVRMQGAHAALTLGDAITSHILKPARPGLRESVLNEAYVMALAKQCGLAVAPTEILHGQINILCVSRVDRIAGDPPTAIHMEDFCQLGSRSSSTKYEREGGPRISEINALIRRFSVNPALDLQMCLRWMIFTFLVGFGGGHAKQLAMLYGKQGPRLAPFYGIWSTHVYDQMSERLGYSIGGEDRPDWITASRWSEFANENALKPFYVLDELERLSSCLPGLAAEVAEQFQRRNGFAGIVRDIRTLIEQRSRQALVSLAAERGSALRISS